MLVLGSLILVVVLVSVSSDELLFVLVELLLGSGSLPRLVLSSRLFSHLFGSIVRFDTSTIILSTVLFLVISYPSFSTKPSTYQAMASAYVAVSTLCHRFSSGYPTLDNALFRYYNHNCCVVLDDVFPFRAL